MTVASVSVQPVVLGVELEALGEEIDGLLVFLLFEQVDSHLVVGQGDLGFEFGWWGLWGYVGVGSLQALEG